VVGGITGPLFTYRHTATSPAGSGPGGFFTGFAIAGGSFYPSSGNFPAAYRGSYFFADYVSGWVGRIDLANGNAAYAFAGGLLSPVDMLVGNDGALYMLTRTGIVRISTP
jgi:glucose/arabinose dehydrogenase